MTRRRRLANPLDRGICGHARRLGRSNGLRVSCRGEQIRCLLRGRTGSHDPNYGVAAATAQPARPLRYLQAGRRHPSLAMNAPEGAAKIHPSVNSRTYPRPRKSKGGPTVAVDTQSALIGFKSRSKALIDRVAARNSSLLQQQGPLAPFASFEQCPGRTAIRRS